jgi:hypothetical protein
MMPALLICVLGAGALAQENSGDRTARSAGELHIRGDRDGAPHAVNQRYRAQLQKRVFAEFGQRQREEEDEQRRLRSSPPPSFGQGGRIQWGYDTKADLRWRRDSQLAELRHDDLQTKTLIRIGL